MYPNSIKGPKNPGIIAPVTGDTPVALTVPVKGFNAVGKANWDSIWPTTASRNCAAYPVIEEGADGEDGVEDVGVRGCLSSPPTSLSTVVPTSAVAAALPVPMGPIGNPLPLLPLGAKPPSTLLIV